MRYRPFGRSGLATSAIALSLDDSTGRKGPDFVKRLIYSALEQGINTYHIAGADPALAESAGLALQAVERRLIFVSLQVGEVQGRIGRARDFTPEGLTYAIDHALNVSGLGHVDMVVLNDPGSEELPRVSLDALKALRSVGRVSLIGVAGENDAMDAYVTSNAFDVLMTPYHLRCGWKERNRLKSASQLDMGVIAYGWFPEAMATPQRVERPVIARKGLFSARNEAEGLLSGAGTYEFLHRTPNWTAEEICLAYALTEPAVATALIATESAEHLTRLASVPDRDLPPGLAAQVEMARFGKAV